MIKPEQVPDEAVNAFFVAWLNKKSIGEVIASVVNAWPSMEIEMVGEADDFVILPLPQEENPDA